MKCKKCGAELMEGIMFCPECGEMNEETPQLDDTKTEIIMPEPVYEAVQPQANPEPAYDQQQQQAAYGQPSGQPDYQHQQQAAYGQPSGQPDYQQQQQAAYGQPSGQPDYNQQAGQQQASQQGEQQQPSGAVKYCPQCGNAVEADALFCGNCAFSFTDGQPAPKGKFQWKKTYTIIAAAVVAVLVVAAIALTVVPKLFSSKSKGTNEIDKLVYLKDNQLNIRNGRKILTLFEDYYDYKEDAGLSKSTKPIQFSEDGKYVFYPSDYNSGEFDLYRKKLSSKKDDAEKIDSDVSMFYVLGDKKVIYLKEDKLSISTIKDKNKVSSNVDEFGVYNDDKYIVWQNDDGNIYIQDINLKESKVKVTDEAYSVVFSDDEKNMMWMTEDGDLYTRPVTLKGEKQKLASDISEMIYTSDDFSKIVFMDTDVLYLIDNFGEKKKIDSDVTGAYVYSDDDTNTQKLYYSKADSEEYAISDFLNDDLSSSDKNDNSDEAELRNEIRKLFSNKVTMDKSEYYYYDLSKKKSTLVTTVIGSSGYSSSYGSSSETSSVESDDLTKRVIELDGYSCSRLSGITLAKYYDMEDFPTIKFSEFWDDNAGRYYDGEDFLYDIAREIRSGLSDTEMGVDAIYDTNVVELDVDDYDTVYESGTACESKHMLYLMYANYDKDDNFSGDYTLVSTNLAKDGGKFEEVSDEVNSIVRANEKGIYYLCDVGEKTNEGDLYLGEDKIAEDVYVSGIDFSEDGSYFYYQSDVGDDDYTLMLCKGKKTTKISDDVSDYLELSDGSVAFLSDYSYKRDEGDLKLYKKGKIKDIDSDVTAIIRY